MSKDRFVYVTYIATTPEKVWDALTDAEITGKYWGHRNESDWQVGSPWRHVRTDGSGIADGGGTIVECAPPRRLVWTWGMEGDPAAKPSRVAFDLVPVEGAVRLTVTHDELQSEEELRGISLGWPAVVANLKTLLETGRALDVKALTR